MLQVYFSSSLRLCVSARDIFFLGRLRDMVPMMNIRRRPHPFDVDADTDADADSGTE
ncbi:MAG: hypothetical protein N838_22165 [Thiohalocapsa sp. PB-PSB1]|nr:MAG: hypothetical protein N838_22165 [Thiohalocapsa sp. PB-PSB1]